MRKWTYLVAALLMSGTAATFTSCIDTTEPAGIENLRGAKADLLRAKALVQEAEAHKREAEARLKNAAAAIKEEKAKQEAFVTALKEAKTQKEIEEIENARKVSAENFKAELALAQQAAAEADYQCQKALLELQLKLATMSQDIYAQELNEFLTDKTYEYEVPKYKLEYEEITIGEGSDAFNITVPKLVEDVSEKITLKGYSALSSELSQAKYDLADLLLQKANKEFGQTDDKAALKAENTAMIAYLEGKKAALVESRDELKQLQGTPVEDWKAKYEQYAKDQEDKNEQKEVLERKLKEDKLPFEEKIADLEEQKKIKSPVKFEADAAIQEYFYEILYRNVQSDDVMKYELESQIIKNEKGEVSFPNGITLSTSPSDLQTLLEKIIGPSNTYYKTTVMDYAKAGNDQATWQQNLLIAKTNMDDAQKAYDAELEIWSELLEDFKAKADAYRYNYKSNQAKNRYDGRTNVIKDIDAFLEKRLEERTAQDTINVIDSITNYLDGRYELDAFKVEYTYTPQGATEPKTITYQEALNNEDLVEDALPQFITLYNAADGSGAVTHNDALGSEWLLPNPKSLYGELQASAEKLWGKPLYYDPNPTYNPNQEWKESYLDALSVLVPYTQEDWENMEIQYKWLLEYIYQWGFESAKNLYTSSITDYTRLILGDGLANDLFASTYVYEEVNSESNPAWNTLLTALEEMQKENNDALKAIDDQIALNKLEIAKLTETKNREAAKIDVQLTTIEGMLDIIGEVVNVTGTGNTATKENWEDAFEKLEDAIIEIDGGVKSDGEYCEGIIAETEKQIKYHTDFNAAIDADQYIPLIDLEIQKLDMQIEEKQIAIEALEALKKVADEKKEILLAGINGTATE